MPSADSRSQSHRALLWVGCVLILLASLHCSNAEAPGVALLIVRAGDPVSEAIAEAYVAAQAEHQRALASSAHTSANTEESDAESAGPTEFRIAALELPASLGWRIEPDEYARWIAAPLEAFLAESDPEQQITTLITTRGIPLHVGSCEPASTDASEQPDSSLCAAAAVDALLAGLGRIESMPAPLRAGTRAGIGQTPNPYFGDPRSFADFRRAHPEAALRFIVARLSGPIARSDDPTGLPASVRALIENMAELKTQAEAQPEPQSAAHSDASSAGRSTGTEADVYQWSILAGSPLGQRTAATEALLAPLARRISDVAGHVVCDACPEQHEGQRVAGIVLSKNRSPRIALDQAGLRLGAPGLAIDLIGARENRRSSYLPSERSSDSSAGPSATEESPLDASLAAWIDIGARFISSHLADPSLAGVAHPDLLIEGLALGHSMGEAHFRSLPHLGWLNVLVGDPFMTLPLVPVSGETTDPPEGRVGQNAAWREDRDRDGVPDDRDNCQLEPNPDQRDTDGDAFGNRCDPDVNNDGQVLTSWGQIYPRSERGDLEEMALTARSGTHDPNHDLDGDGAVDERDLALAQLWLFRGPGPSGLAKAENVDQAAD